MTIRTTASVIAGLIVLLAGCGNTIHGKQIAEPEVARFHRQLGLRDYEQIYSGAAEGFRKSASKETAFALFDAINRKLGPVKSSTQANWQVNTHNFKTAVVLVHETKFESGAATETFTFEIADERASLLGYNIDSLDMLIK
jgi:hypothetical protein